MSNSPVNLGDFLLTLQSAHDALGNATSMAEQARKYRFSDSDSSANMLAQVLMDGKSEEVMGQLRRSIGQLEYVLDKQLQDASKTAG